jgi:hypothetical protein
VSLLGLNISPMVTVRFIFRVILALDNFGSASPPQQ